MGFNFKNNYHFAKATNRFTLDFKKFFSDDFKQHFILVPEKDIFVFQDGLEFKASEMYQIKAECGENMSKAIAACRFVFSEECKLL